MRKEDFRQWLDGKIKKKPISDYISRCTTVESALKVDLDEEYRKDRGQTVIRKLSYNARDAKFNHPVPQEFNFKAGCNVVQRLTDLRLAVNRYFDFAQMTDKQMTDIFDKEKRRSIMQSVRSKGNKSTEIKLIHFFEENGIKGWKRNYPVKGHPDFVFLKQKIAVFVDGCFWHGHDCRNTRPADNQEYWKKKRERNIQHDFEITELFKKRGWTVIRIWECELKKENIGILIKKLEPLRQKDL